jgi:Alcohol acetyltransferase
LVRDEQAEVAECEVDTRAGLLEQFSTMRSHLGIYLNVGMTASYITDRTEPLKTALFRALAQVISQNPSLSAIPIDEHSSHPYFVRIPQIDLERVVAFIETEDIVRGGMSTNIDKILEAEHNRPFVLEEKAAPFWRLVILSSASDETGFVAAFMFHHCLGDGQSGVAFHRCLAKALCQPSSAEVKSIVQTKKTPMLSELERLHEGSSSGSRLGSTEAEIKPSKALGEVWAGGSQSLPVESRFRSVIINTETSDNLISQCRANGTSVTATTQALVSAILFEVLPETFTALSSDCAISVRR